MRADCDRERCSHGASQTWTVARFDAGLRFSETRIEDCQHRGDFPPLPVGRQHPLDGPDPALDNPGWPLPEP